MSCWFFCFFVCFAVRGPLTVVVLPLRSTGSGLAGSRPWLTGPATPRHVGSSRTGARTRVPCIGRRTLNLPGGTVVESLPADTGDTGSCPGLGRSHMPRSGWVREPWPLSLRVRSLCSAMGEATTVRGPRTAKKKKRRRKKCLILKSFPCDSEERSKPSEMH